nr:MAG TPA: hypothetical protein [Caudoviricetes sp.]
MIEGPFKGPYFYCKNSPPFLNSLRASNAAFFVLNLVGMALFQS